MTQIGSDSAYEVLLKIILIGDSGANKTELLQKYIGESAGNEDSLGPTLGKSEKRVKGWTITSSFELGLDYRLKDVICRGKKVKLQLW